MAESSEMSKLLQDALRTSRVLFVDGEQWLVYELPPLPLDRRSTPSLVFENEHTIRRVRNFPPNWRELTDEQLFALSWDR